MSLTWFAQVVVGAAVTWIVFASLTWAWAKHKLLPLARKHAPALMAAWRREQ